MASRGTFPLSKEVLYGPTIALFPYNGTIRFRWGVDTAGGAVTNNYILTALGKWGGTYASHVPIVVFSQALPAATITYANEAAMQADLLNATPETAMGFNTFSGSVAGVGAERWLCVKKDNRVSWVPIRVMIADGTATIAGLTCDIYYADVDVEDIPSVNGEVMDADETFDLCWVINGRHASDGYDAAFKLTPVGLQLQDMIVERVELNARVAGQRAIKKDEMLTRSQLEAGNFVTIGYRDEFGELAGYLGESTKGFNLVIESDDHRLAAGTNIVTSIVSPTDPTADAWGSAGFHSGITKVLFSDEPDWVRDAAGEVVALANNNPADEWGANSVPIKFRYANVAAGEVYYSARTLHTGLWASHNDLTTTTFIEPAGAYGTLGHIQFKDTSSVTWNITTGQLEGTTGYRPGIIVEAESSAPCENPSIQTRWWFTPRWNQAYADINDAAENYFGLRNGPGCNAEMTLSPWGPVTDPPPPAGGGTGQVVGTPDCGLIVHSESKYKTPSAFILGQGRPGHTKAILEARVPYKRYPYVNGALYVTQPGYYHISTSVVLAAQRWEGLTEGNAMPHEYYSYFGYWLMVKRSELGIPDPRWYMHSRLDMQEMVHQNERTLLVGRQETADQVGAYDDTNIARLQSRRITMQGSTDLYLDENDGICLMITMHGNDGSDWADRDPTLPIGVGEDPAERSVMFMGNGHYWCAALTKLEFNMHWVHNEIECLGDSVAYNPMHHPNGNNAPGLSLDYLDDAWQLPSITQPYLKDYH